MLNPARITVALLVFSALSLLSCDIKGKRMQENFGSTKEEGGTSTSIRFSRSPNEMPDVSVSGIVSKHMAYGDDMTLSGARVCLNTDNNEKCTDSDENGQFIFNDVAADTFPALTVSLDKYLPDFKALRVLSYNIDNLSINLLPEEELASLEQHFDFTYNEEKGNLIVSLLDGTQNELHISGAKLSITPDTGSQPIYLDSELLGDTELAETSESGTVAFMNLDEGLVEITVDHESLDCNPFNFQPDSENPDKKHLLVKAGHNAVVRFHCFPQ